MRGVVTGVRATLLWLQVAALAAACSTSPAPSTTGGAGGAPQGGDGGTAGVIGNGGQGGSGGSGTGGTGGQSNLPPGYTPLHERGPVRPDELPEEKRWLADPELWSLFPPEEMSDDRCFLFKADRPERLPFPPLEWTSCGEGCEKTNVLQDIYEFALEPVLLTSRRAGVSTPYLSVYGETVQVGERRLTDTRILELTTGRTVAATKLDRIPDQWYCYLFAAHHLAFQVTLEWGRRKIDEGIPGRASSATWDAKSGSWFTRLPWVERELDAPRRDFMYDAAGRTFFAFDGSHIEAHLDPHSIERTRIAELASDVRVLDGNAEAGLVVWPEKSDTTGQVLIRGWRQEWEEARILLQEVPSDTCAVVLSPTHLVGFGGACHRTNPGRVWKAKREGDSFGKVEVGPMLATEGINYLSMQTWGDFVLLRVGRDLLVRLTDWKTRWIEPEDEKDLVFSGTLSDQHVYLSLVRNGSAFVGGLEYRGQLLFHSLHRYDLTHFETLGKPECGEEGKTCWAAPW